MTIINNRGGKIIKTEPNDNVFISFIAYTKEDIHRAKGFNGFISPEGNFYKVIERAKLETSHDYYAEVFSELVLKIDLAALYKKIQEKKRNLKSIGLSYKDMFINLLGYVNYEYTGSRLDIGCPDPMYNGKQITKKQIEMLQTLITLNRDKPEALYQIINDDKKRHDNEVFEVKLKKM